MTYTFTSISPYLAIRAIVRSNQAILSNETMAPGRSVTNLSPSYGVWASEYYLDIGLTAQAPLGELLSWTVNVTDSYTPPVPVTYSVLAKAPPKVIQSPMWFIAGYRYITPALLSVVESDLALATGAVMNPAPVFYTTTDPWTDLCGYIMKTVTYSYGSSTSYLSTGGTWYVYVQTLVWFCVFYFGGSRAV